jgi:hypothetical protein
VHWRDRWRRRLLALQAAYYGVTGLWPVVHLASFEAVTGPKADEWLVHTVGLLAVAIGAALAMAVARDRSRAPDSIVLAAGSALAFAAIDLWYGLSGRIPPIYLADAAVELGFIAGLVLTRRTV